MNIIKKYFCGITEFLICLVIGVFLVVVFLDMTSITFTKPDLKEGFYVFFMESAKFQYYSDYNRYRKLKELRHDWFEIFIKSKDAWKALSDFHDYIDRVVAKELKFNQFEYDRLYKNMIYRNDKFLRISVRDFIFD